MLCLVFNLFKKRDRNLTGKLVWTHMVNVGPSGTKGVLTKHLLDKHWGDESTLEQKLTIELDAYFKDGPTVIYVINYDCFLVHFDIK